MSTSTMEQVESQAKQGTKYVYFFGGGKAEGNGKMKDVLGGKGAGLAEMTNAGLPVPPGFTIQTEACREYMRNNSVSDTVNREMDAALAQLEELQKQKLGKGENPLLVSVRSGAKFSMPGIENFAPDRTETSSGFSAAPSFWPCRASRCSSARNIS